MQCNFARSATNLPQQRKRERACTSSCFPRCEDQTQRHAPLDGLRIGCRDGQPPNSIPAFPLRPSIARPLASVHSPETTYPSRFPFFLSYSGHHTPFYHSASLDRSIDSIESSERLECRRLAHDYPYHPGLVIFTASFCRSIGPTTIDQARLLWLFVIIATHNSLSPSHTAVKLTAIVCLFEPGFWLG